MWDRFEIQDFQSKMLSVRDVHQVSPLLQWRTYVLLSLVGLSLPYRFWLDRISVHAQFCFDKVVYKWCCPPPVVTFVGYVEPIVVMTPPGFV